MKCKICEREASQDHDGYNEIVKCGYCSTYKFAMSYEPDTYQDKSNFYKVSSWIREQNDLFNNIPLLTNENFDEILTLKNKKVKEKFDLLMFSLSNLKGKRLVNNDDLKVKSWIKDDTEFFILFQKSLDLNFIKGSCSRAINGGGTFSFTELTFDGIQYLEELEEPNKNSKKIFVAFNFDEPLTSIFNTNLKEAIEFEGLEYVVVNQDNVEHNKYINDEIIVKLKTSRIVIADFTNHRNSVYFEAGFAMGMNIPIIWTCQKGHENNMSFDTRQFPHIVWEDKNDLVKQVIDRIKRLL